MLYFIMAMKSKQVSPTWSLDCQLLEGTLRSIANQQSRQHHTIVVHHEKPELPSEVLKDVECIQVDWEPPRPSHFSSEGMNDKWRKLHRGLVQAFAAPPGFVMLMDADDRVSRRLVIETERNKSAPGFIIKRGYKYRSGSLFCSIFDDYNCGTNAVISSRCFDFPRSMDSEERARCFILNHGHTVIEAAMANIGKPLVPFDFRAGMYLLHQGAHSRSVYGVSRRQQVRALLAGIPSLRVLARDIRSEFGM